MTTILTAIEFAAQLNGKTNYQQPPRDFLGPRDWKEAELLDTETRQLAIDSGLLVVYRNVNKQMVFEGAGIPLSRLRANAKGRYVPDRDSSAVYMNSTGIIFCKPDGTMAPSVKILTGGKSPDVWDFSALVDYEAFELTSPVGPSSQAIVLALRQLPPPVV